ncbi:MAG: hypothetical protein HY905_28315 [Deltaproteobacteria bacterium]|nr:hypothetical protein [Deltaproteobacteria bacterium]
MGYETQVEFIGVELRKSRFDAFRQAVEEMRTVPGGGSPFAHMLPHLRVETNVSGYLDWNLDKSARRALARATHEIPVKPRAIDWSAVKHVFVEMRDDDGGTFLRGRWYEAEEFIEWLSGYCVGGRVIQYSLEGDGAVGGWEFSSRGEWRKLALTPISGWRRRSAQIGRRRVATRPRRGSRTQHG